MSERNKPEENKDNKDDSNRSKGERARDRAAQKGGEAVAKKAIQGSASKAAGAAAQTGAKKAVAGKAAAVAGGKGPTSAVGAVGKDAVEAGRSLERGDVAEAGSSAVRGGATIAAAVAGSPILGSIVSSALNTRIGRKLTKGIVWVILGVLLLIMIMFGLAASAAMSTISNVFATQSRQLVCVDSSNGGGIAVSDPAKLNRASTITAKAFEMGLGREGAVIGVMTALAESDLNIDAMDPLQPDDTPLPMQTIGVFQQMPYYWANEYWPAGTSEGDANFNFNSDEYYSEARRAILDVEYASKKFYEQFESNSELSGGKWKDMMPWDVSQTIQYSIFNDGSNYAARMSAAKSTVATVIARQPELFGDTDPGTTVAESDSGDDFDTVSVSNNPCGNQNGTYAGWAGYTQPSTGGGSFTDGPVIYPNTEKALERAYSYVGNAHLACSDGMCYRKCDHLAGDIWGYADYSGYRTAKTHWFTAVGQGIANPGDRTPPIGALLFWDTGSAGHVATYVGDGMVVSNWSNGPQGPNVYLIPVEAFEEEWGAPYYGWADPVFRGGEPGSALDDN